MAKDKDLPIVSCDGEDNDASRNRATGHPLVYLNLGKEGKTECPYCGKVFMTEN